MKKTSRKLFAAVASLGLAVAATVGSTYAWFSMNQSVTATGMTVKAVASSTLLISKSSSTISTEGATKGKLETGLSTQSYTAAASALKPASTVDGTNWFTAEAQESNASTAKTGSYAAVTSGLENYRLQSTMYLQTFDSSKPIAAEYTASTQKLVVESITVTGGDSTDLSNAFRALIVCDSTKIFVAPTRTAAITNQGVTAVAPSKSELSTKATVSGIAEGVATLGAGNTLVDTVNFNQVYTVNVYLYFDGEDADCKSDNIPSTLADYAVDVKFSLANA